MRYNRDLPLIKSNWIEVYFGLFGPELMYYTNNWKNDYSSLVISIILFKFYIKLPWQGKYNNKYTAYNQFGFYFTNEPVDLLRIIKGDVYITYTMPWVRVVIDRYYINKYDNVSIEYTKVQQLLKPDKNYELVYPEKTIFNCETVKGPVKYSITKLDSYPLIFSKLKLFLKSKYLIEAKYNELQFTFLTDKIICIPEQIELQLLARDTNKNPY